MERFGVRRHLALAALAASLGGCSGSGVSDPPPKDPGITVGGLNFVVAGAGYSTAPGALPAADPSVPAPVVTLTGSLDGTVPAQLAVSAAEPFQTVLVLPAGWSAYGRVALPGNATLIGIAMSRDVTSSFLTARVQVAIVRGGKVSAPTTVTLLAPIT